MLAAPEATVPRFSGTERAFHWVHAGAFFGMLVTGAVLYFPGLSTAVGARGTVKTVHLLVAGGWVAALLLIAAFGGRARLSRSWLEMERLSDDDRAWLRRRPSRPGRFNAGQKLHTMVQGAFAVLFTVSGMLLWLGERNNSFRLDGTILLHDTLSLVGLVLVLGHIWMAVGNRATRHSMHGMLGGRVRGDWAAHHHPGWDPAADPAGGGSLSSPWTWLLALFGVLVAVLSVAYFPS